MAKLYTNKSPNGVTYLVKKTRLNPFGRKFGGFNVTRYKGRLK